MADESILKIISYNNAQYIGNTKNNKKDGQGTIEYKNGDIYEGNFKDDKKEGKGIYYYKSGAKYEGEFHNDKNMEREFIIIKMV